jgi:hypothetical protein
MAERVQEPLVCPGCARTWPVEERFCPDCGMPLTYGGILDGAAPDPPSAARRRARKIKPQYTEGALVRVATARHQAEAELIQGVLLEEGVPSVLKRTRGFDVPDMLAAGPRDVLVPASGADVAREALLGADLAPAERVPVANPARLLAWLLFTVAVVAVVAWIGTELVS